MAAPENMYNDNVKYIQTESLMAIVDQDLTSSAVANSTLMVNVYELFVSNANANDEISYINLTSLVSSALALDESQTSETTLLTSSLKAKDLIHGTRSYLHTDSTNVTDEIIPSRTMLFLNTVLVNDELVLFARHFQLEIANIIANDILQPGQMANLMSSAIILDLLDPCVSYYETVISTALVIEELAPWRVTFEDLVSSAASDDEIAFEGSIYSEVLVSSAQATDWLWVKDFYATAWVMNTQSSGLWNYDNFGFTSLAFHAGVLYATSPDGIFALNADKDEGRNIDAFYKGGFLNFGTEHKKHISDLYIGYTGSGLECEIETAGKVSYTYEMEARYDNVPHNSRLKPGRRLSSKLWRFGFRNIDGADFQIQDITALVGVSKRRL